MFKKSETAKDTLLYRGINSDEVYNDIKSGHKKVKARGFTSMTEERDVASSFSQEGNGQYIIFEIDVPKRTPVIDMREISLFADEKEILGLHDFDLIVNSFEERDGFLYVKAKHKHKKI